MIKCLRDGCRQMWLIPGLPLEFCLRLLFVAHIYPATDFTIANSLDREQGVWEKQGCDLKEIKFIKIVINCFLLSDEYIKIYK